MCGRVGWGHAWQILRDKVNERAIHIRLECILVYVVFLVKMHETK